jgi:transposase
MLNLPSLSIEQTAETATQYDFTVTVKSAPPPCCLDGVVLNGTKKTMFRDLPIHGRHVGIWVNRQRYKCKGCGKTLYQSVPHMHRKHEMTLRLMDYIERNSMDRTFSALAGELGLSEFTVRSIFRLFAKRELAKLEPVTPEWMGLDELYILSKFRGVVTNVKDRTLVDMLPNRSKIAVIRYLAGIDDREKIRLVAIDMWNPYREAIREVLPHARIVVDKFHVVRMANEALERIRKEHRVSLPIRGRLQLKDDRWMMLTNPDRLDSGRMLLLEAMLGQFPLLKAGYEAKERFRAVWRAESMPAAQEAYDQWESDLPEDVRPAFNDLTTAMRNWRTEIFTYFDARVTNAYTESFNSLAKMVNRLGRGYSFEVLRAKLLLTKSCHKLERAIYERSTEGLLMGRMTASFMVREEPPARFLGVDLSTLATELGKLPEKG